jgi:glyoxylase-like metal-dependent hydrolase (beta-lactamase superfamily II)
LLPAVAQRVLGRVGIFCEKGAVGKKEGTSLMKPPEVAPGVYRLGTKWAKFYLVADGRDFTVVDSGYPGYFRQLVDALAAFDRPLSAIKGVIVTHHHVDHAVTAEQVQRPSPLAYVIGSLPASSGSRRGARPRRAEARCRSRRPT